MAFQPYDIAMLVPGMAFDGSTLEERSLGGAETAGASMARALARLGHRVTVFANGAGHSLDQGVAYAPLAEWAAFAANVPFDIAIVQRAPEAFAAPLASRLNLLWCHDLALGRSAAAFKGVLWNVDRVMLLSDFHARQHREVYDLPERLIWRTRNGIDLARFRGLESVPRDRKRMVYASRPERGLDVLLDSILPRLLARDPGLRLAVFGYDNPVPHLADFYAALKDKAAGFGASVEWVGPLAKDALYREYARSGLLVYPTPSPGQPQFAEVSCITAMEAMAAGLPIVASAWGALPETVAPDAGRLIDGDPWSDSYAEAFTDAVMAYVGDEAAWERASAAGRGAAEGLDWSGVAAEWSAGFDRLFAEVNDEPVRLARHFYRLSDVGAARAALQGVADPRAEDLRQTIAREYAFLESAEAFAAHYARGGEETDARLAGADASAMFERSDEKRFELFEQILTSRPDIGRILDFGCGHGWCDVYLHNRVGRDWLGVDIDPGAVKWSRTFAERHAKEPARLRFLEGDHTLDLSAEAPFDALLCSEVLEHLRDPAAAIEAMESRVRPGGSVILTVPFGPAEFGTPNWRTFRNHVRAFDRHDLRDLLGSKPGLSIHAVPTGRNALTREAVGFYLVRYDADHAPLGAIDMGRKLRLQRPRQTLSATLIAGPGAEETLRWCLGPLHDLADEIVIADTGLDAAGREIARRFGARLVPGTDPKSDGFEVPRNQALAEAREEWALWIDSDERLVDAPNLHKYLRENMFHGYSLRQHHFAVDAAFDPDLPVRLFRRRAHEGRAMRFFGCIHEHPELALNEGPGPVVVLADAAIAHLGYLAESGRRARFWRNLPLLELDRARHPGRLLQKHFVMRDNVIRAGYELARNGGRVTPGIERLCREAVALYRAHFLGRPGYANVDSLQYYARALEILGEGVDVSFALAAGHEPGAPPAGLRTCRFATAEDLEKELSGRAREALAPFATPYW
ncbi:MAG: glycosyltransferase [Proteobacteria bacterium]|nr:glycosyltransferase [Pseudomonadota bacterium]